MLLSESIYKDVIKKAREIYIETGSTLYRSADDWGINPYFSSDNGDCIFVFYYSSLHHIKTPLGSIMPLGNRTSGDDSLAKEKTIEYFGLELVSDTTRNYERWITYKATKNIPVSSS